MKILLSSLPALLICLPRDSAVYPARCVTPELSQFFRILQEGRNPRKETAGGAAIQDAMVEA